MPLSPVLLLLCGAGIGAPIGLNGAAPGFHAFVDALSFRGCFCGIVGKFCGTLYFV